MGRTAFDWGLSVKMPLVTLAVFGFIAASSSAAFSQGSADVGNKADINHADIHDKVGDGTTANPNGKAGDGHEIHGIGSV